MFLLLFRRVGLVACKAIHSLWWTILIRLSINLWHLNIDIPSWLIYWLQIDVNTCLNLTFMNSPHYDITSWRHALIFNLCRNCCGARIMIYYLYMTRVEECRSTDLSLDRLQWLRWIHESARSLIDRCRWLLTGSQFHWPHTYNWRVFVAPCTAPLWCHKLLFAMVLSISLVNCINKLMLFFY